MASNDQPTPKKAKKIPETKHDETETPTAEVPIPPALADAIKEAIARFGEDAVRKATENL